MPCCAMNGADQERAQKDDRHRAPADALELMHGRGQAQPRRMGDGAQHDRGQRAEQMAIRTSDQPISATARPIDVEREQNAVGCERGRAGVRLTSRNSR